VRAQRELLARADGVIAEAREIWRRVAEAGVAPDDDGGNAALHARLQAEHPDFAQNFPLVLRWMAQLRLFDAEVLRQYLQGHAASFDGARPNTREAYFELLAEYPVLLYRKTHQPREAQALQYRDELIRQLREEDRDFMATYEAARGELSRQAAEADRAQRERLYRTLLALKQARTEGGAGAPHH
jgi:hypothetical protein